MSNSYRIRTTVGSDKSIKVRIDQDFDHLEILSLKLLQNDVYTRQCSDYGVIVGRVSINNGFGIPNARVSIFIPLSDDDEVNNPVLSNLYPYKTLSQIDDDGYRYNLLPKEPSHSNHVPTGTFFTREEVLTNPTKVEIYEKYYKYNSITNESGDYMIYGVPLGSQTIVVNVDLSDIGDFSVTPQDLIRMGVASPKQVGGTKFSSSNNFNQLPQIITINRTIDVQPFWGDENVCVLGITRTDFDLSAEKSIVIQPTAVFMGSIFTTADETPINRLCNIDTNFGNLCELSTGPGKITAIRQTIYTDVNGRPGLEVATLEDGGQVIDGNGAWVIDVPMNLDYVTTNEFGEQVISIDPTVGIPTKGKYRFKIDWSQSPDLGERIKRASYLVPNIKEYGWSKSDGVDPYTNRKVKSGTDFGNDDNPCVFNPVVNPTTRALFASYAFSLDWTDYGQTTNAGVLTPLGEKMVLEAINCEDRFFEMRYNKVYTVSQLYSEYRKAMNNSKFMGIKNIMDDSCESSINKFPTNDAVYVGDTIFVLFQILILIVYLILFYLIFVLHLIIFIICSILLPIIKLFEGVVCGLYNIAPRICLLGACITIRPFGILKAPCESLKAFSQSLKDKCQTNSLPLPMITYPSCDLCVCEPKQPEEQPADYGALAQVPSSDLSDVLNPSAYLDDNGTQFIAPFMTGVQPESGKPKVGDKAGPGNIQADEPNPNIVQYHSSDLPWFERINLFNVKAKYFNSSADNPGGGVNRIGVRFDIDNNGGPLPNVANTNLPTNNCHMDNVIALLIDRDAPGETYAVGKLLSFQDPSLSSDINVGQREYENPLGFNSITGETIGIRSGDNVINDIKVYYAKPEASITGTNNSDSNTTNNLSTNYKIVSKYEITSHMYPIDIEYFQVIHNESVNDYIAGANAVGTPDLSNSFLDRVVDGKLYYFTTARQDFCIPVNSCPNRYWNDSITPVPLKTKFNDFGNLRVVFLVRGVDPNSPKVTNSYDLSRLYGYKSWGKKVVTIKDVKMNIPIRGNHKCTQHNILSNNVKDTYAKSNLFFDTFNWQPSVSSPQVGPGIDPTTVTQYDSNGDPLDGTKYNPPTEDPDYRPANAYSFKSFKTTLHQYYSSIDNQYFNTFEGAIPRSYMVKPINLQKPLQIYGNKDTVYNGYKSNAHTIYYAPGKFYSSAPPIRRYFVPYDNNNTDNRGYFSNEIVDGGNVSYLGSYNLYYYKYNGIPLYLFNKNNSVFYVTRYYSQTYESMSGSGVIPNVKPMEIKLGTSNRQIVMRSDRLPGSTSPETGLTSTHISYTLAGNNGFAVFQINEDGTFETSNTTIGSGASGDLAESRAGDKCGDNILAQFECKTLTPLKCYYTKPDGKIASYPFVKPLPSDRDDGSGCWGNGVEPGTSGTYGGVQPEVILESGCYQLVTVPWKTLIIDYALLIEWRARIVISYAACRGIFSHSFSNNWVNGSLFAFSFINSRRFTKPDKNKKISNKPFNCFCKNNIVLSPSNNFYYRSSPYSEENGFVGRKAPVGFFIKTIYGNNETNLMWPTTMMDLGPRDKFTQEIVSSNDYDGYVVNSLRSTSYQDNTQLLNTLLISRMINKSFIDNILALAGVTAVFRYFSRENKKVDGDYSQAISSNSEIGTISFGEDNYSSCDLYLSKGDSGDNVFGVYWKTDNQIRDYVTPKRNIISEETMFNSVSNCSMEYFPVKTQVVPFYQWFVQYNDNSGTVYKITEPLKLGGPWDSIYGSQINDWMTSPYSGTTFFNYGYQNLDRLKQDSRYFRPRNAVTKYRKGLISGVSTNGDNNADIGYWDVNTDPNNAGTMVQRVVNTGAPFHFYFGLLKGKSSLDKFVSKWVEAEVNLD